MNEWTLNVITHEWMCTMCHLYLSELNFYLWYSHLQDNLQEELLIHLYQPQLQETFFLKYSKWLLEFIYPNDLMNVNLLIHYSHSFIESFVNPNPTPKVWSFIHSYFIIDLTLNLRIVNSDSMSLLQFRCSINNWRCPIRRFFLQRRANDLV